MAFTPPGTPGIPPSGRRPAGPSSPLTQKTGHARYAAIGAAVARLAAKRPGVLTAAAIRTAVNLAYPPDRFDRAVPALVRG